MNPSGICCTSAQHPTSLCHQTAHHRPRAPPHFLQSLFYLGLRTVHLPLLKYISCHVNATLPMWMEGVDSHRCRAVSQETSKGLGGKQRHDVQHSCREAPAPAGQAFWRTEREPTSRSCWPEDSSRGIAFRLGTRGRWMTPAAHACTYTCAHHYPHILISAVIVFFQLTFASFRDCTGMTSPFPWPVCSEFLLILESFAWGTEILSWSVLLGEKVLSGKTTWLIWRWVGEVNSKSVGL